MYLTPIPRLAAAVLVVLAGASPGRADADADARAAVAVELAKLAVAGRTVDPVTPVPATPAGNRFVADDGWTYELGVDGIYRRAAEVPQKPAPRPAVPAVAAPRPFSTGATTPTTGAPAVSASPLPGPGPGSFAGTTPTGRTLTYVLPAGPFGGTNCQGSR